MIMVSELFYLVLEMSSAGPQPFPVKSSKAPPRDVDEKGHVVLRAQVELDGPEQIVGLEYENHLAVDKR